MTISRWPDADRTAPGHERIEKSFTVDRRGGFALDRSNGESNYRAVLMLRDIEELDTWKTAQALGLTASAVKVRLHRGRQALKTLLERAAGAETFGIAAATDELDEGVGA